MSVPTKSSRRVRRSAALAVVGSAVAAAAIVALTGSSLAAGDAVGQPPPEWAANATAWPAHNYDLANTRALGMAEQASTKAFRPIGESLRRNPYTACGEVLTLAAFPDRS